MADSLTGFADTAWHCFLPWLVALGLLSVSFYLIDRGFQQGEQARKVVADTSPRITIKGKKNFIWLAIVLVVGLLGFMSFKMIKEMGKK